MANNQAGSAVASFGVGYSVAAIAIAAVDALEAFIPRFSEWAEETFSAP